jgi:hypothetical protein
MVWCEERDTDIYMKSSEEVHSGDQKAETSRHLFHQDIRCSNSIAHTYILSSDCMVVVGHHQQ